MVDGYHDKLIAVVDDEPDILELLTTHLEKAGFKVASYLRGNDLLIGLRKTLPDLIVLDLMLPDMDGMEICKYLKKEQRYSQIPIIMVTARVEEGDRILGLELGADDYVTKPFSPKEIVARVKAVLRRSQDQPEKRYLSVAGVISIDPQKYEVTIEDDSIDLTSTEFRILQILAERKGWVFTRTQILDQLWGTEKTVVDRTVDVHIKKLRQKLGAAGKFIKNVRGVGYKIDDK
jgi:two-component system phosphate regulon response regulator PhoB/two-component system alkaline phosphatase synthesis response regulator PhoP